MFVTIIASIVVVGVLNAILGESFRQNRLSKLQYRIMAIAINVTCIYLGQVAMGVNFRNPSAVVLALIGGFSMGFQVVNVIARIKSMERTPQNKR